MPKVLFVKAKQVGNLAHNSEIEYFGKEEIVIHQGLPVHGLYIITESITSGDIDSESKMSIEVSALQSGDFFGEVNTFEENSNTISVKALTDL